MRHNPLTYPASAEKWWLNKIASMGGYKPQTTFFKDLSIAECFSANAVKETYKDVINHWGDDIVYMTEFTMCLNHKIWQLYKVDEPMAKLYNELWYKACNYVVKHFKGEDLAYYYEITD